ncbi:S8 family serine peptidase [Candidatus Acetothermia bacterium]|jgi:subtilisin family serine protease|nr:S8 family serine peptidase [Candidatus Acetothermia bacterium]MCI2432422.1 S8 family serine peptidase [Candidatus Acetothermia bacterium]MCI2436321.1 S8 family serine peptidase [Candidatus Acetothermia bacterium]
MRKLLMAGLLITLALAGWSASPEAQNAQALKIQEIVLSALTAFESQHELPELPANRPQDLRSGRIRLVFEVQSSEALKKLNERIVALGGTVESVYEHLAQATVPMRAVRSLAALSAVAWVRTPLTPVFEQGSTVSEGVRLMGIDAWHSENLKGQGVKIAIIDGGFQGYRARLGGELPPAERVIVRSFNSEEDIEADERHGTAVAEVVYDVAPEATLYLVNFDTDVALGRAVDFLISEGVQVINTSFNFFTGCPWEGTGIIEPIVRKARAAGIFWAVSVGNHGTEHWEGAFTDPDNNGFHNFADKDETLSFDADPDEPGLIRATLSWEDKCTGALDNYEFLLFDNTDRQRARGSQLRSGYPLRLLFFNVREAGTYHLKVRRVRGTRPAKLDISIIDIEPEYMVFEGSVSIFEPALSPNAYSIGATDHRNDSPRRYSSRGPTQDGRIKPDFAAPDGVRNTTFRPFFGTSASSPHAAGAAALVKSVVPAWRPEAIANFLASRAVDLSSPGPDNTVGWGRIALGAAPKADEPALLVQPALVRFEGRRGEVTSPLQEIEITNARRGELTWTAEANVPWLKLSASSGTAPAKLALQPDLSQLKEGRYEAQVKISSEKALGSPMTVRVLLTVTAAPVIATDLSRVELRARVGGPAPDAVRFQIRNTGGSTLNWAATPTVPWITLNPTRGTAPTTVTMTVDMSKLQVGTNEGSVEITAPDAANSPFRLPVVVQLEGAAAAIGLFPAQLRFVAPSKGPNPAPQLIEIANIGSGELRWTAQAQTASLKLSATSGIAPALIQASLEPAQLAPGTYESAVIITAENARNSPFTLPVQIQITQEVPAGELITLLFSKLEFVSPTAWARSERGTPSDGCLVYTNRDSQPQKIRVTLPNGDLLEFDVPAGNSVIACGNILYIDLRRR